MKKLTTCVTVFAFLFLFGSSWASQGTDHSGHESPAAPVDHSKMDHGSKKVNGTFVHAEMVDDIHAEFQVMDLATMNIKDSEGNTHHIMASFLKNDEKVEQAAGKVKVISPSGKEQVNTLKHYGSGVFAANFTFDEPGKWGVICLFKDNAAKHTVKFWYPHQEK